MFTVLFQELPFPPQEHSLGNASTSEAPALALSGARRPEGRPWPGHEPLGFEKIPIVGVAGWAEQNMFSASGRVRLN